MEGVVSYAPMGISVWFASFALFERRPAAIYSARGAWPL